MPVGGNQGWENRNPSAFPSKFFIPQDPLDFLLFERNFSSGKREEEPCGQLPKKENGMAGRPGKADLL